MIGRLVSDRYQLEKYLGGGMSSVYLARDVILNRDVVVKLIKVDQHNLEASKARFIREVENTTKLHHPNVVSVLDIDESHEYNILVTEVVEGPTLKEYIRDHNPLSFETIYDLAIMILNGIRHAHQAGIIHRDIKPQNILINHDRAAKITDFGIAKGLSETRMTETNQVMGSVQYISPEQAKGQTTDERTDIYSFGIVLFEMITGEVPFHGETPVSVAMKHLSEVIPDIQKFRTDVPIGLKNIILKCTEKNPSHRYRHIDDVLRDLVKYNEIKDPYISPVNIHHQKTQVLSKQKDNITNDTLKPDNKNGNVKWWMILMPLMLILFVGIGTFLMMQLIPTNDTNTVTLPDYLGRDFEEVEAELTSLGLSIGSIETEYNDNFEEGQVIVTTPSSGTELEVGSGVNFIVAEGDEPYTMENFIGELWPSVEKEIEQLNFKEVDINEEFSEEEAGTILSQSIESGNEINPNDEILELTISQGLESVAIQNFIGLNFRDAKTVLESQGFNVVELQRVYSDSTSKGIVISQDPSYGQFVPGSTISFIVSNGPVPSNETSSDNHSNNSDEDIDSNEDNSNLSDDENDAEDLEESDDENESDVEKDQ